MELFSDELQQVKESQVIVQKQPTVKVDLELEKDNDQRAEERHGTWGNPDSGIPPVEARLKGRLAKLEANAKRAVERVENVQSSMHSVESKLCVVATELRDLKQVVSDRVSPTLRSLENQVGELRLLLSDAAKATGDATGGSARSDLAVFDDESLRSPDKIHELFAAQTQCKQEIRRLQHALVAHDQRVMAQAKEIKRRVAKMKHRNGNTGAQDDNTGVKNQTKQPTEVEAGDSKRLSIPKQERKTELPVQGASVIENKATLPLVHKVAAVPVSGSHATLKQRFANAHRKQQESLNQLREQQQRQHQLNR